tara:strand:+ start:185 stop:433 length:249 start_codon:yes stop_codon:yes gene_type:complete
MNKEKFDDRMRAIIKEDVNPANGRIHPETGSLLTRNGASIYLGDNEIGWCIFFLSRQNRPCGAIVDLIRHLKWYREQIKALQ